MTEIEADDNRQNGTPQNADYPDALALENALEGMANQLAGLADGADALACMSGDAVREGASMHAGCVKWTADKLEMDALACVDAFTKLCSLVYEVAPAVAAERDRIAAEIGRALGRAEGAG